MDRVAILNPTVSQRRAAIAAASRPGSLKNLRVGFVDNSKQNADIFIQRLRSLLRERYGIAPAASVRKYAPKDELGKHDLEQLAKCEAVVQCFGD